MPIATSLRPLAILSLLAACACTPARTPGAPPLSPRPPHSASAPPPPVFSLAAQVATADTDPPTPGVSSKITSVTVYTVVFR